MRNTMISLTVATLVAGSGVVMPARADIDLDINIGAPGVLFEHEPEVVVVPNTDVYYVPSRDDWDVYRYGGSWYANRNGSWFRSRSYRGPFSPIVYDRVPRPIVVAPREYHRHAVRPVRRSERLERRVERRSDPRHDRRRDDDRGRGRSHGQRKHE